MSCEAHELGIKKEPCELQCQLCRNWDNRKIKKAIENHLKKHNEIDFKYPNRYRLIHKTPCKNCPSIYNKENNILDPETEDIKRCNREYQIKSVFPCGWRGSKLCKGYCDEFNINEKDL